MVKKLSTFKKMGYAVAALAMLIPALAFTNTFADCEGPKDLGELQALLNERNADQAVTLCGNINGSFTVYSRMTTINLNGYTMTADEGEAFAHLDERGRLTITGTGNVNGRLSRGFTNGSFVVKGGTWTVDPSRYVNYSYAVYNVDGAYTVEPRITANNFVVSPSEDSEGVFIHKGETGKIEVTLPEGSTSGVTYTPREEGIVEIDADGNITGIKAGWTKVTVSPTYNERIVKEIYVTVYAVEPTVKPTDDQYEGETGAAENLKDLISEALDGDSGELVDKLTDAFGGEADNAEDTIDLLQDAVYEGEVINTKINKDEASLTDSQREEMAALMDGVSMDNIKYYDVTVDIEVEGGRIGGFHEMDKKIRVFLAEATDPEAGYIRKYYVVSYHNGEPELLEENVDYEIVDGKIYLISRKFSVFALGFKDTLAPVVTSTTYSVKAPETGEATEVEGGASASLSMVAVVAMVAVTLAGAAVIAKRK